MTNDTDRDDDASPDADTPEERHEGVLEKAIQEQQQSAESHHTPGTVALTFIFLLTFAVYYFANWKALADVWHVR